MKAIKNVKTHRTWVLLFCQRIILNAIRSTAKLVSANEQATVPQHDGFGYSSLISPAVSAQNGQARLSAYGQDTRTRLFQINVRPDRNGVARVIIDLGP